MVSNLHYPLNPSGSFNLTLDERKSITILKKDKSIVIHPADKGGKIVIQSRVNYIFEAFRQLNDTRFYKEIPTPIFQQTSKLIKRLVDNLHYQGFISKSQLRYLLPPAIPRQRHFYILPKIHKPLDKWTIPNIIPPGRPIVSGCNSESAAIESFIDFYLQPIASSSFSFLRDSNHLKATISNFTILDSDILVTIDVESLYTNIPISEGIENVKQAFIHQPLYNRPDKYILKLLEITLYRNDFKFLDKTFLQIKGTAMGKKYAPSFANIYMNNWEQQALSQSSKKPSLWKRYIDDIFFIWPFSLLELQTFLKHLNSINPNIQLTAKHSFTHVDFLDCTIFKSDSNTICTKVFFKETDTHNLLHPKSYHPSHTFIGIIKAQILRYIRLSSLKKDFHLSYRILKKSLIRLGYSRSLIRKSKFDAFTLTGLSPNSWISGCQPCNQPQCRICSHIISTQYIKGNTPSSLYFLTQNTTCNTRNCIYALSCTVCTNIDTLYVGETKNTFRARFNHHISDIRMKNSTPISLHFNLPNHNSSNVKATIIQFFVQKSDNSFRTESIRRNKENVWINKLHCEFPTGLNTKIQHKSCLVPLIFPFSRASTFLSNHIKSFIAKNQKSEYPIIPVTGFSNNSNLQRLLAPTKLV